jgi:ribosomal protein L7Ae-like RNA K-turn-binding protein
VGPDKVIVPDIVGRLPGKGFWLKSSKSVILDACKKNIFARHARTSVTVPEDLIGLVEGLLRKRCLEIFGLAKRAGQMVGGYEKVRSILLIEKVGVLFMASDIAKDGKNKISGLATGATIINCFSGSELGAAIGRERLVHAVIRPGGFAQKLLSETSRLMGFCDNTPIYKLNK